MQTQLVDVSFAIQDPSDQVISIGTQNYPPATTCYGLDSEAGNNIWLQGNSNGQQRLCTSKPFGSQLSATFQGAAGTYTLSATDFDVLYPKDTETHPIHAPK
jgi:hypothetical protein